MEKNNKLSLSQIGLYNPQRLNDETIEQIFVVRTGIFNQLMDKLQKEKPKGIPQHYLIIGQRGMGKTTLLKRIEVELRKKEFSERFIPLLLPEEQYNLKNLAEFWLNSLDALADTLEFEKHTIEVQQVDTKVKELQQISDKTKLAKEAFQFLKSYCLTLNRRPVMLIDNMSLIFDRMDKDEQHTLRAWLMQNGAPILLGASSTTIEDTYNYGAPFYDAFQIHHLKKLSFEELVEIITNLAKLTQEETILPELQSRNARLKTLHQLTGGNPRTATMLFRVVIKGFSKEINDDLEALLDEITPLYKARFEELPTQLQVIVDAIALNWDPILIEQLRNETRYENNQLSPQLKRLTEAGWIEKIVTHEGKGFAYQISERFFNIWFLMRRSSRRQKRELYCLSKFLESYYGDEIDSVAKSQLVSKSCNEKQLTYNLALADAVKDENLRFELNKRSLNDYIYLSSTIPEMNNSYNIEEIKNRVPFIEVLRKILIYIAKKDFEKAEKEINFLMKVDFNISNLGIETDNYLNLCGILYAACNNSTKAEDCFNKGIILKENNDELWHNLGIIYGQSHKYNESEKAFLKAIELNEKVSFYWNSIGFLNSNHLHNYYEAERAFMRAIELDPYSSESWFGLGILYHENMPNYSKAEKAYLKGIEYFNKYSSSTNGIFEIFNSTSMGFSESKKKETNIEALAPIWNRLGNLYQDYLKNYSESENAYKTALSLDENMFVAKTNLVFLYRDKLNRTVEAEDLFNSLQIEEEFEDSYWLNKTLFELYKQNKGVASEYIIKALEKIKEQLPPTTQDDWWRFGAVASKLGYGNWFTEILEEKGFDIILSPYYVAIKAMNEKDTEGYLNSKAVEIREPARKIMEIMKSYNS